MIKRAGIMFDQVEIESADVPFGIGSGAGVIFGVTGGVTEAVLRKITQGHKRADMEELKSSGVRGDDGIKEIVYDYNGKEIKAAIVSGLANADQLLKKIKSGEIHWMQVHIREKHVCRDCIRQMSIPRLRNQMKIRWYSLCMKDF